jgi:hypothetical protein
MLVKLIFFIILQNFVKCSVNSGLTLAQTCGTTTWTKIGAHPLSGRRYGNRIGRYTELGRGYNLLKGGQLCLNSTCSDHGFKKMIFDI